MDASAKDTEILADHNVPFQVLDRAGCLQYEPALAQVQEKFVGALRLPGDETGDCFVFTQALARIAQAQGAAFRFGVQVRGLVVHAGSVTGVSTDVGEFTADATLVALGSYSPLLIAPLGLRLPVYPVKGYSITLPITSAQDAPESTIMDETHKVAITRLGERIRVGGTAELAGYNTHLREARRATLSHVVSDLFPRGGDLARAEFWCGLRPMTPDGTPVLGPTPFPGLWLATGHGTLGWTMAAGTGQLIADWLSGRPPQIDTSGLDLSRYGRQAAL